MKFSQIMIEKSKVEEYKNRNFATIDPDDVSKIIINGEVLKDNTQSGVEYETITANYGGAFSSDWENSDIKLLFILRESYIMEDSFYKDGHRGGFNFSELYKKNEDLWNNVTYRNIVKITYFTYLMKRGKILEGTFTEKCNEACKVFRRHAAVICVTPFPGLAFNSTGTNQSLLKKWLFISKIMSKLQSEVKKLSPKCVYGAFDLGCISSYEHLLGWFKGKKLEELVAQEGQQNILGRRVTSGGKYDKFTFAIDELNVKWIQGVHPSSRLSHKKMLQIAHIILSKEKNIFSEENIREQIL